MQITVEETLNAWRPLSNTIVVPKTEREYNELVELLDTLIDEVGQDEKHPLASLMDVIGVLIERYEDQYVPELEE
jgi:HTH-type transcriptional regulator / antitoxin HigA